VLYKEHGGYWENRTLGGKHGAAESLVIRPTLSYEDDNLALTLITEHGSMKGDGAGVQTYFADGVKLFEPFKDNFTLQDRTETSDLTWTNAIVEVVWDVFSGSLTSVLGYRELDQEFGSDLDGFLGDRFAWIDGTGLEQDQTSLEVRWAGQLSDKVSLTTGIHLFSQDYTYSERRLLSRVFDRRGRSTIDHSTASLFAQSDINLFEPLVLTLGGRYTRETKDAAVGIIGDPAATGGCRTVDLRNESPGTSFDSLDATANLSDCKQPFKDKESWSNFSPKVGLAWTVNDDFMAYASFTRGFRSGGYNVRFTSANPLTSPGPYNEEVVDAYELGFKSTILDGRFRFNFALFNNSFDDLQRTVLDSSGTQATLNAATATIKGAEIETVLLLTDNLVVEGSFGYTDSGGSGSSDRNLVLISG
jgi:iron complex outermembrane receptor protein